MLQSTSVDISHMHTKDLFPLKMLVGHRGELKCKMSPASLRTVELTE